MTDHIRIFDTTLRDGEQSPGCSMNLEEKLKVAAQLEALGVDIIEAGFAIASEGDFEAVTAVAKQCETAIVASLARAAIPDIDRAWAAVCHARRPRIHTFIATSPLHMRAKLNMTPEQVLDAIARSVGHARSMCEDVEWSAEDATRTEADFLCRAVETAIRAGATTINLPDTVGYATPETYGAMFRDVIGRVADADRAIFSTHCHNDLGLAVANTLAAIMAGARQCEATVNGIGERAGNAAIEEIAMAIRVRHDVLPVRTGIVTTEITKASRLVSGITGMAVQANKAVVGANAFAHESGIHQDGMLKNAETFEIMRPTDIGLSETNLVMGKHSGRAALRSKLRDLGFDLADNQLADVFVRFKALADAKKEVYDDDLIALMQDSGTSDKHDTLQVKRLRVVCGTEGPREAELTLTIEGVDHAIDATGDGPVDAAFNAVKMLYPNKARLQLYQVSAVTEGTDAQATVTVRLEEDGRIATGQSADTDTIVASVKAYVNALNRLIVRRAKSAPDSDVKSVNYRDAS